ncbi:hypothetical protein R3P38DRAFT_2582301 [Favolaschia claudopus]|uniref:Uncharacterized protein n=1 Tax=Favolaschia claudopus TaxID=2862362 RepID=A0AAV9ZAC9_9AGAR
MFCRLFFIAFYTLASGRASIAVLSNRTIDDFNGDELTGQLPVYSPTDVWTVVLNGNCTGCTLQPDPNLTLDRTWHDTTIGESTTQGMHTVTLEFTGVAIYFFGIAPNNGGGNFGVRVQFSLDGAAVDTYVHAPNASTNEMEYSVPMFKKDGLSNKAHTLVAGIKGVFDESNMPNALLFDYAIYTIDDQGQIPTGTSSSISSDMVGTISASAVTVQITTTSSANSGSTSSQFPVAIVVGSVCGIVIFGLIVCVLLWFSLKRRIGRRKTLPPHIDIDAFPVAPPTSAQLRLGVTSGSAWVPVGTTGREASSLTMPLISPQPSNSRTKIQSQRPSPSAVFDAPRSLLPELPAYTP